MREIRWNLGRGLSDLTAEVAVDRVIDVTGPAIPDRCTKILNRWARKNNLWIDWFSDWRPDGHGITRTGQVSPAGNRHAAAALARSKPSKAPGEPPRLAPEEKANLTRGLLSGRSSLAQQDFLAVLGVPRDKSIHWTKHRAAKEITARQNRRRGKPQPAH